MVNLIFIKGEALHKPGGRPLALRPLGWHRGLPSNPPFGVAWRKNEKEVRAEDEQQGFDCPVRSRPAARQ
jgi:hypothetical protein